MLDTVPLSAYAVCYLPLAVTVIGLAVFFFLTDRDATRLYLRRLTPITGDERPSEKFTAEIPAGTVVTVLPEDEDATPSATGAR